MIEECERGVVDGVQAWRDLLVSEYKRQGFRSYREYARWLEVSHATVSTAMNSKTTTAPGLDFLTAFHRKTGYGLDELIELVFPGMVERRSTPLSTRLLMQEFDQLSAEKQEVVRALIRQWRQIEQPHE
jgi:hypothetical protein